MTDQTTPTTVSTLVDHVVVTNTVVEQLEEHAVRLHQGDGQYSGVPRYVADEIGQAVLALVPEDITPEQAALLDAVRDVALSNDAMAGEYAGKQLVRMVAAAFGYPLPEPVQREGGIAGILYGRPIVTNPQTPVGTASVDHAARQAGATGGTVDPKRIRLVGENTYEVQTYPGRVEISPEQAVELGLRPADPEQPTSAQIATDVEGWPFKPGVVVHDEDGAEAEWLDAAPHGVVLRDNTGSIWKPTVIQPGRWIDDDGGDAASAWLVAERGPLTVVSVPDQEPDRG